MAKLDCQSQPTPGVARKFLQPSIYGFCMPRPTNSFTKWIDLRLDRIWDTGSLLLKAITTFENMTPPPCTILCINFGRGFDIQVKRTNKLSCWVWPYCSWHTWSQSVNKIQLPVSPAIYYFKLEAQRCLLLLIHFRLSDPLHSYLRQWRQQAHMDSRGM